jgi:SAM-dependent methyltransferase
MGDPDCLAIYDDAAFYDLEFRGRADDLDFYTRRALAAGGAVLEVACGTGRITLPLARAGVDVTGLDVSAPMLALARRKADAEGLRVEWVHADGRDFELAKTFRLVFVAANALQHLLDAESVDAFFQCTRRHLDSDGRLIVDVFNPDVAKLSRGPEVRYPFKEIPVAGGPPVRVEACSRYDAAEQVLRFELHYADAGGRPLRVKRVAMRCFFPLELDRICRANGFAVEEKFGNYDGQPFAGGSPKQIVVCRPAG